MEFHSRRKARRKLFAFGGIIMAATLVAGCAGAGADAGADVEAGSELEEITLTYADYAQEASGGAIKAFAAEVHDKSGGKITIEPYFAGSLLGIGDMLPGVAGGVADMGNVAATVVAQEMPIADWMAGLTTSSSESFPLQSLETATATVETVLSAPELLAEAENNGVKVLYATANDPRYDMICGEAYPTLESLKGVIVSANGQIWADETAAVGMTMTSVPPAELYEALQRGVVDCAVVSPISPIDYGLWEVAGFYQKMQFAGYNGGRTIINSTVWEGLSDQAKQIIWEALPVIAIEKTKHNIAQYARLATEGPEKHGLEFVVPDDEVITALRDVQAEKRSALADGAPKTLKDPQAFVDNYVGLLEMYGVEFAEALELDRDAPQDPLASYAGATSLDLSVYEDAIRAVYAANAG